MKISTALSAAALVVAVLGSTPLGRAAYEAVLPPNSVGTAQLKSGAVVGSKVKRGSLGAVHFKPNQLPRGAAGPPGPAGPKGDPGEKGERGEPAARLWARVNANGTLAASTGVRSAAGGPPYDIVFDRSDIRSCAYLTSTARSVWAEADAKAGANDTVRVFTGPTGGVGARPFTLVLVC